MSKIIPLVASVMVASFGCNSGKATLGGGPEKDARLIADVYTWECSSSDDDGKVTDVWQGVFGQQIYLQFAPDALEPLDLPSAGGCELGLDMFPSDAGAGGADLANLSGQIRWGTDSSAGEFDSVAEGCWEDDVLDNVHSCTPVSDILESGIALTNAGDLTGAVTPAPSEVPVVTFSHADGDENTIAWGEEITASWDEPDWDAVWVQIRREREGEAWESVTCNVSGDTSFTLDSSLWSLMDPDLNIETNNLYVAFQNSDQQVLDNGLKVETLTRAMAVAVVQD